jgi:hypothetical protein
MSYLVSQPISSIPSDRPNDPNRTETQNSSHTTSHNTQNTRERLQHFRDAERTKTMHTDASKRYLDICAKLQDAQKRLSDFQSEKLSGSSVLPRNLRIGITDRINKSHTLPNVNNDPSFYKEERDALSKLERETEQSIYTILEKAKEKHIANLTKEKQTNTFITREVKTFTAYVTQYANAFDDMCTPSDTSALVTTTVSDLSDVPSNTFPQQEAITHFENQLHTLINEHLALLVAKKFDDAAERERQQAADIAAQEKIVQGAHTGETLTALAQRAAEKLIKASSASKRKADSHSELPTDVMSDFTVTDFNTGIRQPRFQLASQFLYHNQQQDRPSKRTKVLDTPTAQSVTPFHRGGEPQNTQSRMSTHITKPKTRRAKKNITHQVEKKDAMHL